MNAKLMTRTIRTIVVALLVAVAIVVSLGATTFHVEAKPIKTTASLAARTQNQRDLCEGDGGKFAVMDGPEGSGSNTTECKGGGQDGWTCLNTPKTTDCHDATPFQIVRGSRHNETIVWQDVLGNEQPAPFESDAGGNNEAPAGGGVEPVAPDPAATPVTAGPDIAADDPVVADPEPTVAPDDVINDSVGDNTAPEPTVADPTADDGASTEDGNTYVEENVETVDGLYFFTDEDE